MSRKPSAERIPCPSCGRPVRRFVAVLGVPWSETHGNLVQAVAICRRCARRRSWPGHEVLRWIARADPRLVFFDPRLPVVAWGAPHNDLLFTLAETWAGAIFPRRLSREEQRLAEQIERETAYYRERSAQSIFRALGRPFEIVTPDGGRVPPRRWPRKHWRPDVEWFDDDPGPKAA